MLLKNTGLLKAVLLVCSILFAGTALASDRDKAFNGKESYENGWDSTFVFPFPEEDIHYWDKSLPLPDVLKQMSRPTGYISIQETVATGPFPLTVNDFVKNYIEFFSRTARRDFSRWLRRSGLYREIIDSELKKNGMPEELLYLSMIESGFEPHAKSWAGAKGLWQFIRSTGQNFGLRIDYWVDERYDPEKSTRAAISYLDYLYSMFGDWHLAAASYNAGEGKVLREIRRTGCRDYWCLCDARAIKLETRDYLPKIIAAAIIGKNPERYGYGNVEYMRPLRFSKVAVYDAVDLRVIAKCSGATLHEIRLLNPEIIQFCTPPGNTRYMVNIPPGKANQFKLNFAKLTPEERRAFKTHTVTKGESLRKIAAGYGASYKVMASLNGLSPESGLREGQNITVPVPKDAKFDPNRTPPPEPKSVHGNRRSAPGRPGRASFESKNGGKKVYYTIEPGDTLWDIARMFGVSAESIKEWNDIDDATVIQYGDELVVYSSKSPVKNSEDKKPPKISGDTRSFEYEVREGDRCYFIARHYGIHSQNIVEQNDLDQNCTIRPGQTLTLKVPADAPKTPPPTADEYTPPDKPAVAIQPIRCPPLEVTRDPKPGPDGSKKVIYTVEENDSLWWIARHHDVHVAEVLAWNGLAEDVVISPGHQLTIYVDPSWKSDKKPSDDKPAPKPEPKPAPKPAPPKPKSVDCACESGKKVGYEIELGDSMWVIARVHDTHVEDIVKCNGLEDAGAIKPGQTIDICAGPDYAGPAGKPAKKEEPKKEVVFTSSKAEDKKERPKAPTSGKKITYTVEPGESLWGIARKHDTHVAWIVEWNDMDSETVHEGQKLVIYPGPEYKPGAKKAEPKKEEPKKEIKAVTSTEGKKKVTYVVKEGDSLWQIARDHDVHVVDIQAWNDMENDWVKPGQTLTIYVEK